MSPMLPRHTRPRIWIWSVLALCAFIPLVGGAAGAGGQVGAGGPTCFGQVATIAYPDTAHVLGTPGADVIVTDGRTQLVDAREGDDFVCAGGGNDVIGGGLGNDKLDGQGGDDNLGGGPGNDRLKGRNGRDLLNGHRGKLDRCIGGGGFDLASPRACEFIRSAATRL